MRCLSDNWIQNHQIVNRKFIKKIQFFDLMDVLVLKCSVFISQINLVRNTYKVPDAWCQHTTIEYFNIHMHLFSYHIYFIGTWTLSKNYWSFKQYKYPFFSPKNIYHMSKDWFLTFPFPAYILIRFWNCVSKKHRHVLL